MAAVNTAASLALHGDIKQQIDSFGDLVPVEFHGLWGHLEAQFLEGRMVQRGVIDTPVYWFSPASRSCIGFWKFRDGVLPDNQPVQETTLLTLMDDVTGELAYRSFVAEAKNEQYIGFTVNLNISRKAASPRARWFYFQATAVTVAGRKVTIECPLFDAHTGKVLLVARAVFVFMPLARNAKRLDISDDATDPLAPLHLDSTDAQELSAVDLHSLGQVMNFLPHGAVTHKAGLASAKEKRLAVRLDFGEGLSGPPIYVHGGVLGTVLYNASLLLLEKTAGPRAALATASVRDINYHRGVPLECEDVLIDAVVESADSQQVTIWAKLIRGPRLHTTLRTTFALPQTSSKL
ncbi:hypothetical protein GGF46_001739 [Coemansia sp. RSA 552]|nr:hypothetical protein GGF46_001739 [Coemansia sp. RSA 552]